MNGTRAQRRVGLLGGGQLGLMLAESLHALDAEVHVFDPDPTAPARARLPRVETHGWADLDALGPFMDRCDVVTYESENVPSQPFRVLERQGRLLPSIEVLETAQDRIVEKQFLARAGLPHVLHEAVTAREDLPAAAERMGYPFILKTARGGYDGKGQHLVRSPEDLATVLAHPDTTRATSAGWVLEEVLDIALEVSCIVGRSADGDVIAFPLLENAHSEHVLDVTVIPARVPEAVSAALRDQALRAARALELVGLLTVEFFLTRTPARGPGLTVDGLTLFVNELAPRPHNSGHVTRRACTFSQFDALARILVGLPLTEPRLLGPGTFCMGNLLGDVWLAQDRRVLDLSAWRHHPAVVEVYLYGKEQPQARRKMGHFLTYAPDADQAIAAAAAFRADLEATRA